MESEISSTSLFSELVLNIAVTCFLTEKEKELWISAYEREHHQPLILILF